MTDLNPIYDALNWPQNLRPGTHTITMRREGHNLTAFCSCSDWAQESTGVDESSRIAIGSGFAYHLETVKS